MTIDQNLYDNLKGDIFSRSLERVRALTGRKAKIKQEGSTLSASIQADPKTIGEVKSSASKFGFKGFQEGRTRLQKQQVQQQNIFSQLSALRPQQAQVSTASGIKEYGSASPGTAPVSGKFRISQGNEPGHSKGHGASAWDYAVPMGTQVISRSGGTVQKVIDLGNKSYGKYVQVKGDDGKTYIYAHLSGFGVKPGQKIKPNQIVGVSGKSGKSTGPHLHFEVR